MTKADIERAIADDADWAQFKDIDWSKVDLRQPEVKTAISIRFDADVLDFFRAAGPGYQRRILAVLRAFVNQRRAKKRQRRG